MFAHTCTACARRSLIFPGQITHLDNTDHGPVVTFTCWCGATQTMDARRPSLRPAPQPHAA
jgi:hypothetical protein